MSEAGKTSRLVVFMNLDWADPYRNSAEKCRLKDAKALCCEAGEIGPHVAVRNPTTGAKVC